MPLPRRQVISRVARDLHHENPGKATLREVEALIDKLPWPGFVDPEHMRDQLRLELDGARPLY